MRDKGLDRRAFLKVATGTVAIAALGGCDDDSASGADGATLDATLPDPFFTDDFTIDGREWGEQWLNVRYESGWWVSGGAGVCDVPPGVPKALAAGKARTEYMSQPVLYPHKQTDMPVVDALVLAEGPIEAGIVACASFDESYALLVAEDRIVLCRYRVTDRVVLAEQRLRGSDARGWLRLRLGTDPTGAAYGRVSTEDGRRLVSLDGKDDPLSAGFVGALVSPLSSERGGRGKFRSFKAYTRAGLAERRPRFTHRFTGGIVAAGSGYRARVSARTVVPQPVAFEVATSDDFADARTVAEAAPHGRLGAVHAWLEDLEPGTTYYWRPLATSGDERVLGSPALFRTPPRPGDATRFVFASCTSGRVSAYPSFETMAEFDPELLIHAGDWGYADMSSTDRRGDHFQARWIRQLRAPEVAGLLQKTPLVFWQDDHDYASDNGWSETCQEYAVRAFDELHANPSDDYFDIRWGDVHIWCLDCRLYATDPEGPDDETKSRIGLEQKAWLKDGMTASDAPVKIVASAMVFRNKDPDDPGWHSVYTHERDELLQFFSEVDGTVAILSGDSHGHRLIHHFEFGELWEINSSGTDFPAGGQDNYDPEHTPINISRGGGFAVVDLGPAGPGRALTIRTIASDDGSTMFEKKLPVA